MAKILIVEDETDLAVQIKDWFARDKYLVEIAEDGARALDRLAVYSYDAIVLDWMLPAVEGVEVCRRLRDRGDRTPVIMLTARTAIEDMEYGLDCGADYYLKKPIALRELSASVRAAIRRASDSSISHTLVVGGIELNPVARQVLSNGTQVHLEPREFNLLEFLMRHQNRVFSPESLVDRVW
ncbi:MAG: response regulator transcription factor, partial [Candidatus Obscuribacterales bacterium]|nr:response regulator transcription factor [Candidatus Obscuribacterales bacterium]